jgi:two-component system cell cycle sensor histidine kinase/response regulator CckA
VRSSVGLTQQILTNLVVNAGLALDDRGTISVTIHTSEETEAFAVEKGELPKGRYALLEVTDSGRGISEEVRLRIFEPFFTTRAHGTGTGLGLSTVYNILQRCGGGIRVASTLSKGSTFTAYLPLLHVETPTAHLRGVKKDDAAWAQGLHFVVVEDNVAVLGVMQNALGRLGAQVTTATRPDEAIELLENWSRIEPSGPDLVLTDMGMPGGGGSKVIKWMKERRSHIPVAIVSGYIADSQAEAVEGLEVLRKPFLSADLQNFVRSVLRGS